MKKTVTQIISWMMITVCLICLPVSKSYAEEEKVEVVFNPPSLLFNSIFLSQGLSFYTIGKRYPLEADSLKIPDYLDVITADDYINEEDLLTVKGIFSGLGNVMITIAEYDLMVQVISLMKKNEMTLKDYKFYWRLLNIVNAGYFGYRFASIANYDKYKYTYAIMSVSSIALVFCPSLGIVLNTDIHENNDLNKSKSLEEMERDRISEEVMNTYVMRILKDALIVTYSLMMTDYSIKYIEALPDFTDDPNLEMFVFGNTYLLGGAILKFGFISVAKYLSLLPTLILTDKEAGDILRDKDPGYTRGMHVISNAAIATVLFYIGQSYDYNLERRNAAYAMSVYFGLMGIKTMFDKDDKFILTPVVSEDQVGVMASKQF